MVRLIILSASLLALCGRTTAREFYVAPNGTPDGTGSLEKPFKSIQQAVDRMQAGDICTVRGGTCREAIQLNSDGIRLQAFPGEEVIFDGTDPVTGNWKKHEGVIYKIQAPKGIEQLFAGRKMMIEARWPNMTFEQRVDRERWSPVDHGSIHGKIVSQAIADTGIDWTGAIACLNVAHQWWTWNRPVTQHEAGSPILTYDADLVGLCYQDPATYGKDEKMLKKWADDYFYLFGKLEALDAETEWFQDQETGTLYFYAPGGVDPSTLDVNVKVRDYAVYARNRNDLEIKGIHFFGTTFRLEDCNHCIIEDCSLLYPSYARTITEYDQDRRECELTKVVGDNNIVRRCSLAYANNIGLMMMGNSNRVENCIIHDVNWYGTLIYPGLQLSASPHLDVNWFNTIQYPPTACTPENAEVTSTGNVAGSNTIYNTGGPGLVYHAADSIVEYNHVYDGGLACKDVSLIYGCWPFSRGSIVRYNWVHGCQTDHTAGKGEIHGGIGIRADDQSRNNMYHHNVVWDCGRVGIMLKGDDNSAFNNTVFDIGTATQRAGYRGDPALPSLGELVLMQGAEPVKPFAVQWPQLSQQNTRSKAVNNAVRNLFASNQGELLPDSGQIHHNLRHDNVRELLRDPEHFDFRPADGSPMIDAGTVIPGCTQYFKGSTPDIGAYEAGGEYWIPGADWKESDTGRRMTP
jgi:hypothetical protein